MIFTSINFLLFFPTIVLIYYLLPKKYRWRFLLIVSILFYANVQPIYAVLLVLVSTVTYVFAILIEKENVERKRDIYLFVALCLVFSPLFLFKYYNFVNENILNLLSYVGLNIALPEITLILPIGISFYTFMAIGYLVDVFNEEVRAEKNLGLVTLFLSFFPLVLSGPIERGKSMIPQFRHELDFDYIKAVSGFQLMLWGYFMKLVVADRIAIYVDAVIMNMGAHSGQTLLLAVLLYPLQIYGDLGGYSLIAIGAAKIMGINVRPNFNRPFVATSVSEFWRRWHMSLISWILDYVYTPLSFALRRFRMKGTIATVLLTLFIMGMWHGASLTFLMWAFYQGIFISLEAITKNKKNDFEKKHNLKNKSWYIIVSIIITYFIFSFSFLTGGNRHSFPEGLNALNKIFTFSGSLFTGSPKNLIFIFIGVSILLFKDFSDEFFPNRFLFFKNRRKFIRLLSYAFIIVMIILFGVFDGGQFIYFKY